MPALKAKASDQTTDTYTVITRDDSPKQWAYKGKPLYTFAKDQKLGDITGDGFPARCRPPLSHHLKPLP